MSNYVYEEKSLVPGLNACHILPSGRILCRHPNNEGSVLVFDQYGTQTKLYIPDAKFRDFSEKKVSSSSSYNTQLHTPILEFNKSVYLLDSNKSYSIPFVDFTGDKFLTDEQLQIKLDSRLNNGTFADDFTAQDGTDKILLNLDTTSPAALAVRDLVPTGLIGCNLPNIYELSVIWLESDNIDSIDPTINEYSDNRLGSPTRFKISSFWTCTEVQYKGNFNGLRLGYGGQMNYLSRDSSYYVLPVLEL